MEYRKVIINKEVAKSSCKYNLKELTEEALKELYGKNINSNIKQRYDLEFSKIKEGKFEINYIIPYIISQRAKEDNKILSLRGSASSSLINYLLKISSVDPIKYDLPVEMYLGYELNNIPTFDFCCSAGYSEAIINFLKQYLGEENVCIINTETQYKINNLEEIEVTIYEDEAITILEELEQTTNISHSNINVDDTTLVEDINKNGIDFEKEYTKNLYKFKPQNVDELVKVFSITHGTDIIEENTEYKIKDLLCSRDDIFNYLIQQGMDKMTAYNIMEFIRKGCLYHADNEKVEQWSQYVKVMKQYNVSDEHIKHFEKIKYMFSKAHALNYVLMYLWITYYKKKEILKWQIQ